MPAAQRDVGDVGGPDLVDSLVSHVSQQVGVDLVPGMRLAGGGLRADRLDAHLPHQPPNALAAHGLALAAQLEGDLPRAEERAFGVDAVDLRL